uniref:Uncharacterized protein n=1 Tax=Panagrolaimus sp. JU765 TaxID=591449 RepID=A0AC34RRD9_9BILA
MSIIEEDDLNSVSNENSALLSLQQNLQDPTELEAHNYDTLETENLVLRRNMPRLYD